MKKEKWKTFVTDRWKVAAPGLLAAFAVCFIFFMALSQQMVDF